MDRMQIKTNTREDLCMPEGGLWFSGCFSRVWRIASVAAGTAMLSAALLLGGCSKEDDEIPGGTENGLTTITLSPESMGEVAMGTRAVSGVDENKISDLWVIHLNSAGTAALATPQYFSGDQLTNVGGKYTVNMKVQAENSRMYFIANTHNSSLFNGATTSALVEAKTLTLINEASLAENNTLPMAGYLSGVPSGMALSNITLKRAVAKLTFKLAASLPSGCSFSLTSVKVCNVPKVLHWFRDPLKLQPGSTAEACYPVTSAGFFGEFCDLTPSDKTLSATAKDCGWCYLPENGRGTGTATEQKNKTAATALGGASGQGNYATYIDIRGTYKNSNTETISVRYRCYLGTDAIRDYNVLRGTHYTVTATIKNASFVDSRVEANYTAFSIPHYDYTDNATGLFVIAQTDLGEYGYYNSGQAGCWKIKGGWDVPTFDEMLLSLILEPGWDCSGLGLTAGTYMTSSYASGPSGTHQVVHNYAITLAGNALSNVSGTTGVVSWRLAESPGYFRYRCVRRL